MNLAKVGPIHHILPQISPPASPSIFIGWQLARRFGNTIINAGYTVPLGREDKPRSHYYFWCCANTTQYKVRVTRGKIRDQCSQHANVSFETWEALAEWEETAIGICKAPLLFFAACYCAPRSPIGLITTATIRFPRCLAPWRKFCANNETDRLAVGHGKMGWWTDWWMRLCSISTMVATASYLCIEDRQMRTDRTVDWSAAIVGDGGRDSIMVAGHFGGIFCRFCAVFVLWLSCGWTTGDSLIFCFLYFCDFLLYYPNIRKVKASIANTLSDNSLQEFPCWSCEHTIVTCGCEDVVCLLGVIELGKFPHPADVQARSNLTPSCL